MDIYLVGGAVRDRLLGLPVTDKDFVVVGATQAEMTQLGYRSVGSDFPVYLHPETHEEYALARTERKIAPGHKGFECRSDPDVTLEEDLMRRDLTINAIAETSDGGLIDPYGGQADIKDRVIRHVSPAFTEDPLRILRVARFKARFHHLGFEAHPDTTLFIKGMVTDGLLSELTPERVLLEVDKALATKNPAIFFQYLSALGGHDTLWPEISAGGIDRLHRLDSPDVEARFCALVFDNEPEHIRALCQRLKTSKERRELASLVSQHHGTWCQFYSLTPEEKVSFIQSVDGIRKEHRFQRFNQICDAILEKALQEGWIETRDVVAGVRAKDLEDSEPGPELGKRLRQEQIRRVGHLK